MSTRPPRARFTARLHPHAWQAGARLRALALVLLLVALVWAPALGRLHQVAHGGGADHAAAHTWVHGPGAAHAHEHLGHPGPLDAHHDHGGGHDHGHQEGLLALLLADHGSADCLLLDQLALGDALHTSSVALAHAPAAPRPTTGTAGRLHALHAALFRARAPPLGAA